MSKFIIYDNTTGKVWRDLDQYTTEEDGTIFGGINGVNTLRYPPAVNPAIITISEEEFNTLDENLAKYKVVDGKVVEDPDYAPYNPDEEIPTE